MLWVGITVAVAAVLLYLLVRRAPRIWFAGLTRDAPSALRDLLSKAGCDSSSKDASGVVSTPERGLCCAGSGLLCTAFVCGVFFLCASVLAILLDFALISGALVFGGFMVAMAVGMGAQALNYRLVWDGDKVWYRNSFGQSHEFTWADATAVSRCPKELAIRFGKVRVECWGPFARRAYEEFAARNDGDLVFERPHAYYTRSGLGSYLLAVAMSVAFVLAFTLPHPVQSLDRQGVGPYEVMPTNVHVEDGTCHMTVPEHDTREEWRWDDVIIGRADQVDAGRLYEAERSGTTVLVWGRASHTDGKISNLLICWQVLDKDGGVIFSYDDYLAGQEALMPTFIVVETGIIGVMLLIIGVACLHEYLKQRRLPQTQALEDFVADVEKAKQKRAQARW